LRGGRSPEGSFWRPNTDIVEADVAPMEDGGKISINWNRPFLP